MPTKVKNTPHRSPAEYADIKGMREERSKAADDAHKLVIKVRGEKRDMSSEEKDTFDKLASKVEELDDTVKKLEGMMNENDDEDDDSDADDESDTDDSEDANDDTAEDDGNDRSRKTNGERRQRRNGDFYHGDTRSNPTRGGNREQRNRVTRRIGESDHSFKNRERRSSKQYFEAVQKYLQFGMGALSESRALQADIDIIGGYLILPEKLSDLILKKVDDILWVRQYATIYKVENARSMGIATLDNDPSDGDWTTEIAEINADSQMSFGKRSLTPSPVRKRLLVSERMLRMAFATAFESNDTTPQGGGSTANIVIDRLAYKIAHTQENAFWNGNGINQPLGMFAASTRGIATDRDVLTGSSTNLTYAGLVNAKYTLKAQYQKTSKWMFHREAMALLMQLVDANGRPLLNFMTLPDQPTTLLQSEVLLSELIPSTFTTGLYVGLYGDLRFYNIVDSQEITVKQADQLYAETGQIGFFITAETDGMPVLEEAFARLKCN